MMVACPSFFFQEVELVLCGQGVLLGCQGCVLGHSSELRWCLYQQLPCFSNFGDVVLQL